MAFFQLSTRAHEANLNVDIWTQETSQEAPIITSHFYDESTWRMQSLLCCDILFEGREFPIYQLPTLLTQYYQLTLILNNIVYERSRCNYSVIRTNVHGVQSLER